MMAKNTQQDAESSRPIDKNKCENTDCCRRSFLSTSASVIMGGGLVGGYGMFFAMAGRYFYPSSSNRAWVFVSDAKSITPGGSISFKSPAGVDVMVTRRADEAASGDAELTADSFLALSSVCPHLGCRVHWEPHNDRYFCPCHNGIFDPEGIAIGGPPAADGQRLPNYNMQIVNGALYIEMPISVVGKKT